jgi:hypothetical protein
MMAILPSSREQMVQYFEAHNPVWAKDPAAIGLTPGQIVELDTRVTEARAALSAQTAAINTKLAASENMRLETDDLRGFGADLIKVIKAFAESTDDPAVYVAAEVPPPSPPTPTGPPDMPTNVTATLDNFGQVKVEWNGSLAVGTQFILQRQLLPVGGAPLEWVYAGSSTTNDYTDATVPTGFAAVSYRVYAQRAAGTSDASGTITLNFGTEGGASQASSGDTISMAA